MKTLITWLLNQVMLQEALQQAGASPPAGGSHPVRTHRCTEGASERLQGSVSQDPKFREFPFEMQVFGRYARVEKAQVNAIVKSCHQGVSTRKIQEIASPPGIDQVSSVPVSRIAQGPRRPGAGIPPAADRTGYPIPLRGCFILQGVQWRTLRPSDDPDERLIGSVAVTYVDVTCSSSRPA